MNFREALKQGIGRLRAAGVASPVLAAELLLMHVAGASRAWLYVHIDDPLDPAAAERYFDLVGQRAAGAPTQYLTGHQEFWGLDFEVTPDVLIPRPETEHIVEVALERIGQQRSREALLVADVGTGSGCLAVALARELPQARVFATDISLAALAVARRNAERHGVAGRLLFVASDILSSFRPRSFDLVVSNPPYVGRREATSLAREIREHEPGKALFAGEEGIEVYPLLVAQAMDCLCPAGVLVVELGYGVSERVMTLLDSADWRDIGVTSDLAGIPRVLAARRV
ncbi:MAG TPA: peptide chain release factor N(5)-glutamine methyltransferase [Patescibacteria group bacterium]|nr:peptide chain release factor N(5)-glutamine methyltransferase [Patescibacteria group bacterium]